MHVHVHVHVGGVGGAVVDYFHKYHVFVMNRREGGYMHLCHSANAIGAGRHM